MDCKVPNCKWSMMVYTHRFCFGRFRFRFCFCSMPVFVSVSFLNARNAKQKPKLQRKAKRKLTQKLQKTKEKTKTKTKVKNTKLKRTKQKQNKNKNGWWPFWAAVSCRPTDNSYFVVLHWWSYYATTNTTQLILSGLLNTDTEGADLSVCITKLKIIWILDSLWD